jgi:hypothetical protein
MRNSFVFVILFCCSNVFGQEDFDTVNLHYNYDTSFVNYLEDIRTTCRNRDTLLLHELFGDSCFGWSCYGAESPTRMSSSDWIIFKSHFNLINTPDSSNFWNFFLQLSEEGAYFDSLINHYRVPSFHKWEFLGWDEKKNAIKLGWHAPIPKEQKIIILSKPDLDQSEILTEIEFQKEEYLFDSDYKYKLKYYNSDFYELFEKEEFLGYIEASKLMWWNYHFDFNKKKETNRWCLTYYEVCYY